MFVGISRELQSAVQMDCTRVVVTDDLKAVVRAHSTVALMADWLDNP